MAFMLVVRPDMSAIPVVVAPDAELLTALLRSTYQCVVRPRFTAYVVSPGEAGALPVNMLASVLLFTISLLLLWGVYGGLLYRLGRPGGT